MSHIAIITGTTRPNRFGEQPARWLQKLAVDNFDDQASFDLVDLRDLKLPMFDEPASPSMAPVTDPAAIAWTKQVDGYDGFLIVTAEYNHSVPAVLKNAIDYVAQAWRYKPVAYLSYGAAAGGARAVEHLRQIAGETRMYDLRQQLLIPNYYERLNERGEYQFSEAEAMAGKAMVEAVVFWADAMKAPRAEFSSRDA